MRFLYFALVAAAVVAIRVVRYRRRRGRNAGAAGQQASTGAATGGAAEAVPSRRRSQFGPWQLGDLGLIAMREITERIRGRIFRVGTLVLLVAVALAVIIPSLHKGTSVTRQTVGVVGTLSPYGRYFAHAAAAANQDALTLRPERSLATARRDLATGRVDVVIVDERELLLQQPATASTSPADPYFVEDLAQYLGVLEAYRLAGLTPAQAVKVDSSKPVPVRTVEPGSSSKSKVSSVVGLVLLFMMLTQYCTWILIGVMQEKSSRVVEVLLAAVRPLQLLGGKVLGIGLVALGQATLVVGFALVLGEAVGSDILKGSGVPLLLSELFWLVLGYAFYCWVYAAAGSTAERQDQVQTLALPISIPILFAYVYSITVASTGSPNLFFDVLAYVPPTAPFCMSVLVGLGRVSWWQFAASALITVAATAVLARFAARIYRRAVLRTGGRVRIRELFASRGL